VDVRLTHPDKVLWPDAGVTKQDLADYFAAVADRLLPALADRPVTLKRFPEGIEGQGFFQKNLPKSAPKGLRRWSERAESAGRTVDYLIVDDADVLRWLAQMNVIELHPMPVRVDRRDRLDQLILDLDPADDGGPDVATAASWAREVLDEVELEAWVKSTGKRGLHLVMPIERRYSFEEVRGLSLALARAIAARHPEELTVEMRKAERGGRLLLDWSRAGSGQTVVAPWSPRAIAGAPVAAPVPWEDVRPGDPPTPPTLREAAGLEVEADEPGPQRLERAVAAVTEWGFPPEDRSPRARTG
jgi:bifunctional non-homologous end joining protein LigD